MNAHAYQALPAAMATPAGDAGRLRKPLALLAGFLFASLLPFLAWNVFAVQATFRFSAEKSVPLPGIDRAWVVGALVLCAALLCLSRVHASLTAPQAMLVGLLSAAVAWFAILSPVSDAGRLAAELVSLVFCLGFGLIGIPLILASRRSERARRSWSRRILAVGILSVLWLDATLIGERIGAGDWWKPLVVLAVVATLVRAVASPYTRRDAVELALGAIVLCGWTGIVAFTPWNRDKQLAMSMRGIQGEAFTEVMAKMADQPVEAEGPDGRDLYQGLVRDLDRSTLARTGALYFFLLGGCRVHLDGGRVRGVYVNRD